MNHSTYMRPAWLLAAAGLVLALDELSLLPHMCHVLTISSSNFKETPGFFLSSQLLLLFPFNSISPCPCRRKSAANREPAAERQFTSSESQRAARAHAATEPMHYGCAVV
jgi:hypothetical protein